MQCILITFTSTVCPLLKKLSAISAVHIIVGVKPSSGEWPALIKEATFCSRGQLT